MYDLPSLHHLGNIIIEVVNRHTVIGEHPPSDLAPRADSSESDCKYVDSIALSCSSLLTTCSLMAWKAEITASSYLFCLLGQPGVGREMKHAPTRPKLAQQADLIVVIDRCHDLGWHQGDRCSNESRPKDVFTASACVSRFRLSRHWCVHVASHFCRHCAGSWLPALPPALDFPFHSGSAEGSRSSTRSSTSRLSEWSVASSESSIMLRSVALRSSIRHGSTT